MNQRVLVASNRGPVSYQFGADGSLTGRRGGGGMIAGVTDGLAALAPGTGVTWICAALSDADRAVARSQETGPRDERGIPVGEPQDVTGTDYDFRPGRKIGATRLDHALTGLARDAAGRAWAGLAGPHGSLALWAGAGYGWLQVFTGDTLGPDSRRRALAIEPMTCPPNAFVTGTDLLRIAPGDGVTHQWGLQTTRV